MFDIAACLDAQPLPAGRRVAIVTNAGGPGILAVDACEAAGLTVAAFSDATRDAARAPFCRPTPAVGNPVDMVASAGPDEYRQADRDRARRSTDADALIVIFTPVDAAHVRRRPSRRFARASPPARRAGATGEADPRLRDGRIRARSQPLDADGERMPAYAFPENAARALGKVAAYARVARRSRPALLLGIRRRPPGRGARDLCRGAARRAGRRLADRRGSAARAARVRPAARGRRRCAHTADDAAALAARARLPGRRQASVAPHSAQDATSAPCVSNLAIGATPSAARFDELSARAAASRRDGAVTTAC